MKRRQESWGDQSPRSEDTLEAVYHLIMDKGYATTTDISTALKVKPPTVSVMIGKLAGKGYLEHTPYRGIRLTPAGEKLAKSVIRRHRVIEEFLTMLGVDEETAFMDTEGIEHHVHPATVRKLEKLADYLKSNPSALGAVRKSLDSG